METNEVKSKDLNEQYEHEANCSDQQKLSYEELENIARQLSEQSKKLYGKLQESNMFNTFKRLDYLFKVVELSSNFNNTDFIERCKKEIVELMTIDEEATTNNGADSDIDAPQLAD